MIRFPYEWDELVSIHASPQRQGELFRATSSNESPRVSIHASPQRQGERDFMIFLPHVSAFQSTPHLSGKANNFFKQHGAYSFLVSIHASPQRQGERHHFPARLLAEGFNPRLTSAARRTSALFGGRVTASSFNPRLTSAARRTSRAGITGSQEGVSIHASPQRHGEKISEALKVVDKSFNPRLTSAARRTSFLVVIAL